MGLFLTRRVVVHFAVWLSAAVMAGCGGGSDPPPAAVAPTIASQPAAASVTAGLTATFNVTASGTAPLAYQWRRGGVDIAGANAASYTTPATVIADNGVLFSVVVTNASGSVTSADVTLTVSAVLAGPSITGQPAAVTVAVGSSATFSVTASGSAPLAYQWRRNGADIAGATAASYVTAATIVGDDGARFSVVVSNGLGSVTSSEAVLTVTSGGPGPAPFGRYLLVVSSNDSNQTSGTLTLSATDGDAPGPLVTLDQVPAGFNTDLLRIRGGALDPATRRISDPGVRNVVYTKGGSLYRVRLDKVVGVAPASQRLSTETQVRSPEVAAVSDAGDEALLSYYINDNSQRYVLLSADASTTPRGAPVFPGDQPPVLVGWATNPVSGAITTLYWRSVRTGGSRLFSTDPAFGNATSLATFATGITSPWLGVGVLNGGRMRDGMFFFADGALRRLDYGSGNVRIVQDGVTPTTGNGLFDDTHAYLLVNTPSGRQLLRAADDASSPAQVLASATAFGRISTQTDDHLVFITGTLAENATSVRKTDGRVTALPRAATLGFTWFFGSGVDNSAFAGDRVFYLNGGAVGSVRADGTDRREHSGSSTSHRMAPASVAPHRLHAWELSLPGAKLLLWRAGALTWLDASTGDLAATVGSSTDLVGFSPEQKREFVLGRVGVIGHEPTTRIDAYFLTDQVGSLLRLTNFIP